jgi:hypothetical protein
LFSFYFVFDGFVKFFGEIIVHDIDIDDIDSVRFEFLLEVFDDFLADFLSLGDELLSGESCCRCFNTLVDCWIDEFRFYYFE